MKPYLSPVPIGALLVAIFGAVTQNYAIVVAAILVAIAAVGFISARNVQAERSGDPAESLSQESRTLLRPIQRLSREVAALVEANKDSPTISVIGAEALAEATRMTAQVARTLQIRDDLKKALKGRYQAEKEIGESRMRLEFASATERVSLEAAIEARTAELGHYDEIGAHLRQIETGVNQAEAVLAEIKAKLSLNLSQDAAALGQADDLRDTLSRMRSLSNSYEEAENFLRG